MRIPAAIWQKRPLCALAVAAFLLKAVLATVTFGTNDSLTWDRDVTQLRCAGFAELYRHGVRFSSPSGRLDPMQPFIHPPAVVTGLRLLGMLQDATGLPVHFWIRLACSVADIGTLVAVATMVPGPGRRALLLLAASPVSILVSGFHGNTDPIMTFFVVLAVAQAVRRRSSASAAAFALACAVKLVPVIYAPAMILYLPTFRDRAKWIAVAALVWLALSMPYVAREPALILKTTLGYGSAAGLWGFYFISAMPGLGVAHALYAPAAKWIALLGAATLPFAFKYNRSPLPLFTQCGAIAFFFLFLSPGFGLQYLSWTVPWIVALGAGPTAAWYAIATTFLLAVYLQASGGAHLHAYADLLTAANFQMLILVGFVCWLSMAVVLWRYGRAARVA